MGKRDNFRAYNEKAFGRGHLAIDVHFRMMPGGNDWPERRKQSVSKQERHGLAISPVAAGGPGARRYVKGMTKAQRTSINNGIFGCAIRTGKLVDTDERHRFTIPMLKKWRKLAEFRAQFRQEYLGQTDHCTSREIAANRVC